MNGREGRQRRKPTDSILLLERIEKKIARLHWKVDRLIEVASCGGDQAAIDAITAKLKASNDAKEKTVEETENT